MLDRVSWTEVPSNEVAHIIQSITPIQGVHEPNPETSTATRAELPFYKNAKLIMFSDSSWAVGIAPFWFVEVGDTYYLLDGSSAPIHDVNEAEDVELTEDTVALYAEFFCFFVHGDEGPFLVVEEIEHPAFDTDSLSEERQKELDDFCKPFKYELTTEVGTFEVTGTILYGNALFDSRFAVTNNGMIEMIDDEPLAADIPVRMVKPNYVLPDYDKEKARQESLPVFHFIVSSTYYDFEAEIDAIAKRALPRLRNYCSEQDLFKFNPIHLPWGIKDAQTPAIENYISEIKSKSENHGVCFVVMAGNRNGDIPVPYPADKEGVDDMLDFHRLNKDESNVFAFIRNIDGNLVNTAFDNGTSEKAEEFNDQIRETLKHKLEVFTEIQDEETLNYDYLDKFVDRVVDFVKSQMDDFAISVQRTVAVE